MNKTDLEKKNQKGGPFKAFFSNPPKWVAGHMCILAMVVLVLDISSKIVLNLEGGFILGCIMESLTTIGWSLLVATYSIVHSKSNF